MTETQWDSVDVQAESLNPVEVENRIIGLIKTLSNALGQWKGHYKAFKEAEHAFDIAVAVNRNAAAEKGITANDRKYYAEVQPDVVVARQNMDTAEVLFKYTDERLRSVRAALSAWQSVGRSVQSAYINAGRGDF